MVVQNILILCLLVQGGRCAERAAVPDEEKDTLKRSISLEKTVGGYDVPVREHEVIVQYKAGKSGVEYQARWDVYGVMASAYGSVEALLEESLLLNDVCHNRLIDDMLKNVFPAYFGHEEISFDGGAGGLLPLSRTIYESSVLPICARSWEPLKETGAFEKEEVRLVFARGALKGHPGRYSGKVDETDGCVAPRGTALLRTRESEKTYAFRKELARKAQEEQTRLYAASNEFQNRILVRCMTATGVRGVEWRAETVVGVSCRSAKNFLLDMVLQGTSQGYTDDEVRHFAFYNKSIKKFLKRVLGFDLQKDVRVDPLGNMKLLKIEDLKKMQTLSWTVVPTDKCLRPDKVGAFVIMLGNVALEGIPQRAQVEETLLRSRNYLRIIDGGCEERCFRKRWAFSCPYN